MRAAIDFDARYELMKGIFASAALVAALLAAPAQAAVVSGTMTGGSALANGGSFQLIAPASGFVVGNDVQQNNNLYAFNEQANATLLANITPSFGPVLVAGTRYNSHFIFFDPAPNRTVLGRVTFDAPILAVLGLTAQMNASDASFGLAGVTYLTPAARGLESNDSFTVSGNTLMVDWVASTPGDYIRVLTAAAVPEPATWMMMILGFGLIGASMRARKVGPRAALA
jgi:hypothetical protein